MGIKNMFDQKTVKMLGCMMILLASLTVIGFLGGHKFLLVCSIGFSVAFLIVFGMFFLIVGLHEKEQKELPRNRKR